jgi:hypothetical protein
VSLLHLLGRSSCLPARDHRRYCAGSDQAQRRVGKLIELAVAVLQSGTRHRRRVERLGVSCRSTDAEKSFI